MKIYFLTLALDALPWIAHHVLQFNKLSRPWEWHVIEGVAEPVHCTSWCKRIEPRVSSDGTHEYLKELARYHPRVFHHHAPSWPGKCAMLNYAMEWLTQPGIVLQVDSDELWLAHQIENIAMMFEKNPDRDAAYFKCDYWLGPAIKTVSRRTYGDNDYEWLRAFRYTHTMKWVRHEPPVLGQPPKNPFTKHDTEAMGLIFQHPAYATEKQVAFKQEYYQYPNAVEQWRKLQAHDIFPCRAGDFLAWIKDDTIVDRICT